MLNQRQQYRPAWGEWHGAPFSVFSWLSGHDSKLSQREALCWCCCSSSPHGNPPSSSPHANSPLTPPPPLPFSPLSPLFSSFSFSLPSLPFPHPPAAPLPPPVAFFLSLLLPRTALHDREAKNSTRNPRINSEAGGGKSAHTRSYPPAPPRIQRFSWFAKAFIGVFIREIRTVSDYILSPWIDKSPNGIDPP